MEVLSEDLKSVKLDVAMFLNSECSSPWCERVEFMGSDFVLCITKHPKPVSLSRGK